jgi:excisionase family DNA binding protein
MSPANKPAPRRLLDLHDVADVLHVSRDTVDRMLRAGRLKFVRLPGPGGRRRVVPEDLEAAIESWKVS